MLIITFPLFIPSSISSFAFNIFSLEPRFPMCDVPIFDITHSVGFAICVSSLSSPAWFIPISITNASWSFSPMIVIGSPSLLFWFPFVFCTLNFCSITLAITSFVLVFPTLPVIATTGMLYITLLIFAISTSASSTFSTFTIVTLSLKSVSSSFVKMFSWTKHTFAPLFIAFLQ